MSFGSVHIAFMDEALSLAKQARPSPNPRVGAVIVKNGKIIGKGFHQKPGDPHAEIVALHEAGEAARNADLYVTLEPCIHFGRTGPCVDAVIQAGILRTFIGMTDPDKRVNGKGIESLRRAGIQVEVGVSEIACRALLEGYVTHRTLGRPRVILKAAVTLDGYLATASGESKWISSPQSRQIAHALRSDSDAVLVGSNTVINDDPQLTVRDVPGLSPLRIVLDSTLKIPTTSKLFHADRDTGLLLVHSHATKESIERVSAFSHVETLQCEAMSDGHIRIDDLVSKLGDRGVLSLLVEGGRKTISAFLRAESADELILFIAPKILGNGIPWTDYPNAQSIAQGLQLIPTEVTRIGDDLLYRATIVYSPKDRGKDGSLHVG